MPSSGDLLADRRYAYAEAAFADEDWPAAADLARQTLDLAPGFAAAWLLLGRARDAQGAPDEAVAAFRRAVALDPADELGAGLYLARLGAAAEADVMSPAYVRRLFDDYAVRFDRHLRRSLKYRGPELLHDAVRRACRRTSRPFRFAAALDLGCGTGLAAELFRPECRGLAGIDLSAAMVRKAEGKRLYDELAVGDLTDWLEARPSGSADLALALDVFVYLADLAPVFRAVTRLLRPGGLFGFTVQSHGGEGVRLGADHRFAHGESYLRALAAGHGLDPVLVEATSTRQDRGQDVPGIVLVLAK